MFVVGASKHRTTESLGIKNWHWNIKEPYPNVEAVNSVKIVPHDRTFYVFGGYVNNQVTSDILGFRDETWSRVGSLTSIRTMFSIILNIDKVYVIGGKKKQKYEICTLSSTVNCEQDTNTDFQGSEEPVLFGVSKNGSCDLTISNYESKETKKLMIFSNATFSQVDNFVFVQKTNYRNDKYIFFVTYSQQKSDSLFKSSFSLFIVYF